MKVKGALSASVAAMALAPVLVATPAAAQDASAGAASEEASSFAEDIVVTARRRDERLIDVPVAVTAVTGETLENYSVSRVADLATLVPSMVTGRAASGSSASIFLRGVGSTALSAGFDQSVSFVMAAKSACRNSTFKTWKYCVVRRLCSSERTRRAA